MFIWKVTILTKGCYTRHLRPKGLARDLYRATRDVTRSLDLRDSPYLVALDTEDWHRNPNPPWTYSQLAIVLTLFIKINVYHIYVTFELCRTTDNLFLLIK